MTVHLVEFEGRGGPFQHSVAMAEALHRDGVDVVLHTASDPEFHPAAYVPVCLCMDWLREAATARRPRVALRFLFRTLPHLLSATGHSDVLHLQGPFKPALIAATVAAARLRGARIVFSPHNTFSRKNRAYEATLVRWSALHGSVTVVYSRSDAAIVRGWGGRSVLSPLTMHVPMIDKGEVEQWRASWGQEPVVLFAGQIRRDKRLDLLIEASAVWRSPARLAVVGQDAGDAARCHGLVERLGIAVDWTQEYVPLDTFLAAVAAADLIVCPYARGSSSGVLAVARQLGTPAIAVAVGGLGELASDTIPPESDVAALAQAVDAVLQRGRRNTPVTQEKDAIAAHRRAYGLVSEPGDHT